MEPLLFDMNGAQNQPSNPVQAPSNCSSTEHLCTKRRLDSHKEAMSQSPRKKRKCNTAPPGVAANTIKEHEYKNLSLSINKDRIKPPRCAAQSASPHHQSQSLLVHPTVTILSSYDDSSINDGHHSNVAISRKTKKTQLTQCNNININTIKVENEVQQQQKKPVFSMTIQKKTNNVAPINNTVSVFNMDVDETPTASTDKEADINTVITQNNGENHNPNHQTVTISSDFVKEEQDAHKAAHLERIPKQNGEASPKKEGVTESGEIVIKQMQSKQIRLMRLLLDAKRVGGLIGKGGCAITKIRQKSRAKILIAKPIPHSLFRICSIEGEYEQIVSGINLVVDKMAEESTRLPPFQITVLVEEKNIGCLIGKKGNAITEIRNNTKANIYISSHLLRNSSEKTVDICGERDAVHCAIEMVIKRLCSNPSYVSTRMAYDPSMDFIQTPSMKSAVCEQTHALNASTYHYPYHFAPNNVNNPRLLNYALSNRFGAIPSVQPQIISTSMPTPSLLTPLLSNTAFAYSRTAAAQAAQAAAAGASFNIPQTSNNPNLSKQTPSNSMTSHVSNLQNMQNMPMHHSNAKSNNNNMNSRNINNNNVITHNNNNNNNNRNNVNNNNNNNNANNYIRSVLSHSNNNTHTQNNGAPHANNSRYPHFQRVSPYSYSPRIIPPTAAPHTHTHAVHSAHAPAAAAASHTSVVLPVSAQLIGGVIGRGGRNIQEIRRQTNAEIKIDNERQNKSKERYITINGTPQQISTAVYMIQNSLATHT